MLKNIKAHINRSFFKPGLIGLLVNPFHIARSGLYRGIQKFAPNCKGKIADIGCGSKPYEHLFDCSEYVGLDLPRQHTASNILADLFFDGKTLPLADASFDSAVAFQVFEHVFTPPQFLAEIHRVLKPEGLLLLTVPFVWDEHEQPFDFARYSSFGLKAVLENAGF
ncbi:MAG: class I SAM-dependent methyltransferase, partial [Phycisphaeraceae bacterium]|nr:class I SAM-dependent methyltransferase [Phycisphaeraceae bacterium]